MSDQVWFYEKDQKATGPVSEAELWKLLDSGKITKNSLVWKEPMEKWLPFSEVPQLKIPPKPKPPPMPEPEDKLDSDDTPFQPPEPTEEEEKEETYEYVEKVVFKSPDYEGGEATTMDAEDEEVSQVRPWVRFFARMIDYYIFSMLFSLLITLLFPDFMEQMSQMLVQQTTGENSGSANYQSLLFILLFRVAVTFIWVFIEAYTISKFGTTFGKNLLGTKVLDVNGELLPPDRAMKRSYSVWIKGMGCGFALISWLTMLLGYQALKRDGLNSWDEENQSRVVHRSFSTTRILIILAFFIILETFALQSLI